jgi:hypothetical protein
MGKHSRTDIILTVATAVECNDVIGAIRKSVPSVLSPRSSALFTPLERAFLQQCDEMLVAKETYKQAALKCEASMRAWVRTRCGRERLMDFHSKTHHLGCTCINDLVAEQEEGDDFEL